MKRILVIDDEESITGMLEIFLSRYDFKVVTLSKAAAAISVINEFKPDVILLDIKLADYDGRDISMQLKASKKTKHIKIILFSGQVLEKEEYKDYEADDFIAKPFNVLDLLEKINYQAGLAV